MPAVNQLSYHAATTESPLDIGSQYTTYSITPPVMSPTATVLMISSLSAIAISFRAAGRATPLAEGAVVSVQISPVSSKVATVAAMNRAVLLVTPSASVPPPADTRSSVHRGRIAMINGLPVVVNNGILLADRPAPAAPVNVIVLTARRVVSPPRVPTVVWPDATS